MSVLIDPGHGIASSHIQLDLFCNVEDRIGVRETA